MSLDAYRATGTNNSAKQVSVDRWNNVLASVETATDRTELAATPSALAGMQRYLAESGREGPFVFSTSDHSANVTADTTQAVYIAPSTNTTGASGAWVRKFTGPLHAKWAGAKLDNATDDSAAVLAIHALAAHLKQPTVYYNAGALPVYYDGFAFMGSTTLDLTGGVTKHRIIGRGGGRIGGGYLSGMRWSGDVDGIRHNLALDIEHMLFYGPGTGTVGRGLVSNGRLELVNTMVALFGSHGCEMDASVGGTGTNANLWYAERSSFWRNGGSGWAVGKTYAGDTNGGIALACDFSENGRWGVEDHNFLQNKYDTCHFDSNGKRSGYTPSQTSDGTYRYAIVVGQEANALTTAPSGTTADNAVWFYVAAGGADGVRIPLYSDAVTAGTVFAAGGSIRTTNANSHTIIMGCYNEGGSGPAYCVSPTIVMSGQLAKYTKGPSGSQAPIIIGGGLGVLGISNPIRATSGTVSGADGIGYITGDGGTVTQITNKNTNVTLDKLSGEIVMEPTGSIAAGGAASFLLLNNKIAAADALIVNVQSNNAGAPYSVGVTRVAAVVARITVRNHSAGALAEAITLNFTVIKGVKS